MEDRPIQSRVSDTTSILGRLQSLHPKIIDLSLDRMHHLLSIVGNPERRLPPVVHVAGTNGKGSTIAFLRAILEAAGHRVHVYTSPHLVRFNERIRLAGQEIDDETLASILEECEAANAGRPITYFEITTVAAFLAFARVPADVLLLEVGLGGRLDTTNVVEAPLVTAITPVSMDHMQYLGDTLAKIAFEKAGIIKPSVPVVIGPQRQEALSVIQARAAELDAPTILHGRDFSARLEGDSLRFEAGEVVETLDLPALVGAHQVQNAAVAVALARQIAGVVANDPSARSRGVGRAVWPARLQRLTSGPLIDLLPKGWALWLDGGHNAEAGEVAARQIRHWRDRAPGAPIHLVLGMLNTKAVADYLAPFRGLVDAVRTVAIPGEAASLTAEDLAATASETGLTAVACDTVDDAVTRAVRDGGPAGTVLIAGSLYLAGSVLRDNG